MIRVWLTSEEGEGYVSNMDFPDLESVKIYTSILSNKVLIEIEEIDEVKDDI